MVSVLGRFLLVGLGSPLLLLLVALGLLLVEVPFAPLLVGPDPLLVGWVVSVDISRSVPEDCDMLRGRFLKPFRTGEDE